MNLGGRGCSESRWHHCTPAWGTEQDSVSKKKKVLKLVVMVVHIVKILKTTEMYSSKS